MAYNAGEARAWPALSGPPRDATGEAALAIQRKHIAKEAWASAGKSRGRRPAAGAVASGASIKPGEPSEALHRG
jgi:hypothetical protein